MLSSVTLRPRDIDPGVTDGLLVLNHPKAPTAPEAIHWFHLWAAYLTEMNLSNKPQLLLILLFLSDKRLPLEACYDFTPIVDDHRPMV